MEVGSHVDDWGTQTNTNWDLIEHAVTGFKKITAPGSGNVSISAADGATDEQRYKMLEFIGPITGNVSVVLTSVAKEYLVRNSTTGSFNLTLLCSAGGGIVIPQGHNTYVWCDGTTVRSGITKIESITVSTLQSTSIAVDYLAVSAAVSASVVNITGKVSTAAANVVGILSVDGAAVLKSTLSVDGAGTFKGNVSVSGAAIASTFRNPGFTTLTQATSITWNLAENNMFVVSLSGNAAFNWPSNPNAAQCFAIYIVHVSASTVPSFLNSGGNSWHWETSTTATWSTAAGSRDIVIGILRSTTDIDLIAKTGF